METGEISLSRLIITADDVKKITERAIVENRRNRSSEQAMLEEILSVLPQKFQEAAEHGRRRVSIFLEPANEPSDRVIITPEKPNPNLTLSEPLLLLKRNLIRILVEKRYSVLHEGTRGCLNCGGHDKKSCFHCDGTSPIGYSWEGNGWSKFGLLQIRW